MFCILFIFGVLVVSKPYVNDYNYSKQTATEYENFLLIRQDTFATQKAQSGEKKNNYIPQSIDYDGLWKVLTEYNQSLLEEQMFSETGGVNVAKYGVTNGIIGYIKIPRLNVTMPIRIGSSKKILNQGAGVMIGSSLPIGQVGTNSVIVAHRGWDGMSMFRHIERLKIGDEIIIDNLFERLIYVVNDSKIVNPTANENLVIRKNKDMITLYTCHPYGINSHRFLVFCERKNK